MASGTATAAEGLAAVGQVGELVALAWEAAAALGLEGRVIASEALRGDCRCFVARDGQEPVGFCLLFEGTAGLGERVIWLELMYVRPGIRGAAELLRSAALELGRARGLPVLFMRRREGRRSVRGIREAGRVFRLGGE